MAGCDRPSWTDRSHPDHLILILKGPSNYAGEVGDYLKQLEDPEFHYMFGRCLEDIMRSFGADDTVNIVHTWLNKHCLPVDAKLMDPEIFAKFHDGYNAYINTMLETQKFRCLA